jgi:hypothetical protein
MTTSPPEVSRTAAAIYDALGPTLRDGDDQGGWLMLLLLEAGNRAIAAIEDLVRDNGDTPGWTVAADLDVTPAAALPWLGQWVGLRPRPELDPDTQRSRIRDRPEWRRGTPAYFLAVAREYLTGNKHVELYERDAGNPHHARVRVFAVEVPDEPRLQAAMTLASGWIKLNVEVVAGQTYDQLAATHPGYDELPATFPTYDVMTYSLPGA